MRVVVPGGAPADAAAGPQSGRETPAEDECKPPMLRLFPRPDVTFSMPPRARSASSFIPSFLMSPATPAAFPHLPLHGLKSCERGVSRSQGGRNRMTWSTVPGRVADGPVGPVARGIVEHIRRSPTMQMLAAHGGVRLRPDGKRSARPPVANPIELVGGAGRVAEHGVVAPPPNRHTQRRTRGCGLAQATSAPACGRLHSARYRAAGMG